MDTIREEWLPILADIQNQPSSSANTFLPQFPGFNFPYPTKKSPQETNPFNDIPDFLRERAKIKKDISSLPLEVHVRILQNVTFLDQLACERVCHSWRTIIRSYSDIFFSRYVPISESVWANENVKKRADSQQVLVHRFIQDGNFAFRARRDNSVELMSWLPNPNPQLPPRRFKILNLTFLNDPVAVTNERRITKGFWIRLGTEPYRCPFRIALTRLPYEQNLKPLFQLNSRDQGRMGTSYYRPPPDSLGQLFLEILGILESPYNHGDFNLVRSSFESFDFSDNRVPESSMEIDEVFDGSDYGGSDDFYGDIPEGPDDDSVRALIRHLKIKFDSYGYYFLRRYKDDFDKNYTAMQVDILQVGGGWDYTIAY